MNRIFLIILFSTLNLLSYAQSGIKGKVYNSETKETIPYVSIGIENRNTGTISNSNGEFNLKFGKNVNTTDSITFSSIGFKKAKYSLKDIEESKSEIFLSPTIYELNNILVTNQKTKKVILGRNHEGSGMLQAVFFSSQEMNMQDRISREMGMLFKTKHECLVNSFNFFIQQNNYKNVKFRLTFYSIENGLPKEIIVNQNIIFDVKDKYRGWFKIDLAPYSIYLKSHTLFAATITLLEDELTDSRNMFAIPGALLPNFTTFRRDKTMSCWKKNSHAISMFVETKAFIK